MIPEVLHTAVAPRFPLKIVFVVSATTIGGTERQLQYLLSGFPRGLVAPSVVTVLAGESRRSRSSGDLRDELPADVPVTSLDLDGYGRPGALLRLARCLSGLRADVVQVFGLAPDLAMRLLRQARRTPVHLASIRGLEADRSPIAFAMDGLTGRRVDLWVANSHQTAQIYAQRAHIPGARIVVVPNGLDASAFRQRCTPADRARLRGEWNIADDEPLVAVVGHLSAAKGHYDILDAAAGPSLAGRSTRFLFCGHDTTGGELERAARRRGLAAQVLFAGRRTDIAAVLAASDAFLLASHHEGLPNALMEAMVCELPCVATAVGGVSELATDGETALLIPAGDPAAIGHSICTILDDPALGRRLGANARRFVESHHNVELMVRRTTRVIVAAAARWPAERIRALAAATD